MSMYGPVKRAMSFAVRNFFRAVHVRGAEPASDRPVVFVGNHPNFALDALVITSVLHRDLWYLAKSGLFVPPFDKVLRALHLLPVFRRHESDTAKNEETFRAAAQILGKDPAGAILIFPEGMSIAQRELLPLKTGTARLAFQAEAMRPGVLIQPVGITYSELHSFRVSVTVAFNEPISVSGYVNEFAASPGDAVRSLTAVIEERLRGSIPLFALADHTKLAEDVAVIFESASRGADDLARLAAIAGRIEERYRQAPHVLPEAQRKVENYLNLVKLFGFHAEEISDGSRTPLWKYSLAPFLFAGAIINYLPYQLTGPIAVRLSSHAVTIASYKFMVGLVIFSAWYLVLASYVGYHLGIISGILCFLTLMVLGKVMLSDFEIAKQLTLGALWPGKSSPHTVLQKMRDDLITELEQL